MSIEIMNIVRKCPISSPGQKFLMMALADYANDEFICWPSIHKLQQYTAYKSSAIRSHLKTMEEAGWISRERIKRDDGTLSVYRYTIHAKELPAPKSGKARNSASDQRQNSPVVKSGSLNKTKHNQCQNLPVPKSTSARFHHYPVPESDAQEPPLEPSLSNADALERDARAKSSDPENYLDDPPPVPPPKAKSKPRTKKRDLPLPEDWEPEDNHIRLAKELGFTEKDLNNEADKFRDWTASKDIRRASWSATFNNWLRRAREYQSSRSAPAPGRMAKSATPASDYLREMESHAVRTAAKSWADPDAIEGDYRISEPDAGTSFLQRLDRHH